MKGARFIDKLVAHLSNADDASLGLPLVHAADDQQSGNYPSRGVVWTATHGRLSYIETHSFIWQSVVIGSVLLWSCVTGMGGRKQETGFWCKSAGCIFPPGRQSTLDKDEYIT